MTSGVILREERLAHGVQQQDLARELGIRHSAVSQLEQRPNVRLGTAQRYRAALAACRRRQLAEQLLSATVGLLELEGAG